VLPTSRWRPGEIIRDRFELRVPTRWADPTAGGALVLGLRMTDARRARLTPTGPTVDGDGQLVRIGEVALGPAAAAPAPPPG
jgi:hypothetical protein